MVAKKADGAKYGATFWIRCTDQTPAHPCGFSTSGRPRWQRGASECQNRGHAVTSLAASVGTCGHSQRVRFWRVAAAGQSATGSCFASMLRCSTLRNGRSGGSTPSDWPGNAGAVVDLPAETQTGGTAQAVTPPRVCSACSRVAGSRRVACRQGYCQSGNREVPGVAEPDTSLATSLFVPVTQQAVAVDPTTRGRKSSWGRKRTRSLARAQGCGSIFVEFVKFVRLRQVPSENPSTNSSNSFARSPRTTTWWLHQALPLSPVWRWPVPVRPA